MASSLNGSAAGSAAGSANEQAYDNADDQSTSWSSAYNGTSPSFSRLRNGGIGRPSPTSVPHPQDLSVNEALSRYEQQFFPGEPKSLSGVATRSFLLGIAFNLSTVLTLYVLVTTSSPLWRPFFFLACIFLFHFLEFWTTARYNTRAAQISSFLLTQNGSAYTVAHTMALVECILTNIIFPNKPWPAPHFAPVLLFLGFILVIVGQLVRSVAMIEAGTNFNHIVQYTKSQSHQLVTSGIYGYLRHPSYFGFFWWGLGTQIVLGNFVCFVAYAVVLWRFFSSRISSEEKLLVKFFGQEYLDYRKRTRVGIPFIP